MFQTIINKVKEVWQKMFSKGTIESKINMDIAMSNEMQTHIDLCKKVHENKAPWIDNETVFSSNTGQGIASEFARLVTIEFKSEISNNEFLNKEYQVVIDNIRNYTQFACAEGGLVFKPYVSNGHIEVDMVRSDMFFPTSFNSRGEILGAIFLETKVVGDTTYTRLECHELIQANYSNPNQEGYQIRNIAFKKKNYNQFANSNDNQLGDEISLTEVQGWENLQPEVTIRNVDRPLFAYFKMPLANTIDSSSPLGVSVYSSIVEPNGLLQKLDEQFSRIDWEYKGSELGIDIDSDMLKKDSQGNPIMPVGKERLYRKFDIDSTATGTSQWNVFSPAIRDISLYNGYNELKRQVEFQVGLQYGTLSNMAETAKTATEILASKERSYQTVSDIQKALRIALEALVYSMSVLGILYKLPVKAVNIDNDLTIDFGDSLMTDTESDNNSMFLDVSSGILDRLYYVMKKYKVTESEAKKMMAATEDLIEDNPLDKGIDKITGLPINSADEVVESAEDVTQKQLNGAQTQSLIAVISQYTEGTLTIGQAINVISIAIGVDKTEAKKILEGAM